jgi:hypothetical protein
LNDHAVKVRWSGKCDSRHSPDGRKWESLVSELELERERTQDTKGHIRCPAKRSPSL